MVVAIANAFRAFHIWWSHCLRAKLGNRSVYLYTFLERVELSHAVAAQCRFIKRSGIEPPSSGFVEMNNEVRVWFFTRLSKPTS